MLKRTYQISVRLTEDELERLNRKVAKTELSREGYLRTLLKTNRPAPTPKIEYDRIIFQLKEIGRNMNQIAVTANSIGQIDTDAYNKNLQALNSILKEIMEEIKKDR